MCICIVEIINQSCSLNNLSAISQGKGIAQVLNTNKTYDIETYCNKQPSQNKISGPGGI